MLFLKSMSLTILCYDWYACLKKTKGVNNFSVDWPCGISS
jgi:hypothetical protein